MPWLGIDPATSWCMGGYSTNWAHWLGMTPFQLPHSFRVFSWRLNPDHIICYLWSSYCASQPTLVLQSLTYPWAWSLLPWLALSLCRVSSLSELCSSSLFSMPLSAADGSWMTYIRAAQESWVLGVELEWVLNACGRAGDKMASEVSWSLMLPKFSEDRGLVNTYLFIYSSSIYFTLSL